MKLKIIFTMSLIFLSQMANAQVTLIDGVMHTTGHSDQADLTFSITLSESAPSLNIFIQGNSGNADLKMLDDNSLTTDCEVGYSGSNEACVIKSPGAGTYTFEILAKETFDQLSVYASTQVYAQQHTCLELNNETVVNIQNPAMSQAHIDQICSALKATENLFHSKLNTQELIVDNDQNDLVNVNIFANQPAYMTTGQLEQNMQDNASTGIYFESNPESRVATADVNTFEARRWADGEFFIWELTHEYVHYLDGRYNKQGGYSATANHHMTWWTEGLAEYIADNDSPYLFVDLVHSGIKFSLSDIIESGYDGEASPYTWGSLLVRFMVEQRMADLETFREYARNGQYSELDQWLVSWANDVQQVFDTWQTTTLLDEFKASADPLQYSDEITSTSQHGKLYYFDSTATENLTVSTTAGGGDVDLYLAHDNVPNRYQPSSFICRSIYGATDELCSIQNTLSGRYYVLLDAPGHNIFVNTKLTATNEFTESTHSYAFCDSEVPYSNRESNVAVDIDFINNGSEEVLIFWLNNTTGVRSEDSYAKLTTGKQWQTTWSKGDVLVVTDSDQNCLTTYALPSGDAKLEFNGTDINASVVEAEPTPEKSGDNSSSGGTMMLLLLFSLLAIKRQRLG